MELVIRNKGCMVAKIIDPFASQTLTQLKKNLTPAEKSENSKCMAVYRLNQDLNMTVAYCKVFLWKDDTTVAVFL